VTPTASLPRVTLRTLAAGTAVVNFQTRRKSTANIDPPLETVVLKKLCAVCYAHIWQSQSSSHKLLLLKFAQRYLACTVRFWRVNVTFRILRYFPISLKRKICPLWRNILRYENVTFTFTRTRTRRCRWRTACGQGHVRPHRPRRRRRRRRRHRRRCRLPGSLCRAGFRLWAAEEVRHVFLTPNTQE
jgi:hypothetical protein